MTPSPRTAYGAARRSSSVRVLPALITRGFVLTLYAAADVGSVYEPAPTLTYTWDPDERAPKGAQRSTSIRHRHGRSFDLGPHPADPSAMSYAPPLQEATSMDGPRSQARQAIGQEIWVYEGNGGYVHLCTVCIYCAHCILGRLPFGASSLRFR